MLKVTEKPMVMKKKMIPLVMAIANGIIRELNFVEERNNRVNFCSPSVLAVANY